MDNTKRTLYRDGVEETIDAPVKVTHTREGHVVEKYTVDSVPKFFVTLAGTHFCAHGSSVAEAITDALWKDPAKRPSMEALVEEIKAAGLSRKITLNEFRILTGACAEGCRVALKRAGVTEKPMTAGDITEKVSREWGMKLQKILGWVK